MALNLPTQHDVEAKRSKAGLGRGVDDFPKPSQASKQAAVDAIRTKMLDIANRPPSPERKLETDNAPNGFQAMREMIAGLSDEVAALRKRIVDLENGVSTLLKPKERKQKMPADPSAPKVSRADAVRKARAIKWLTENPFLDKPDWVTRAISDFSLDVVE